MNDLIPLYQAMAADGENFKGLSILQHMKQIRDLVKLHKARTLLDYGCGAGEAWRSPHRLHREFGMRWIDVQLYDPAFPLHSEPPYGMHDGVLCSDVLEHVPEADVDATIEALFMHARRFVWASVCCREAKKCFPDGANLHVTIKPLAWWETKFSVIGRGVSIHKTGTENAIPFTLVETP